MWWSVIIQRWPNRCCNLIWPAALKIGLSRLYSIRKCWRCLFVIPSLRHLPTTCSGCYVVVETDWVWCSTMVYCVSVKNPNVGLLWSLVIYLTRTLLRSYFYHIESLIRRLCRRNLLSKPTFRILLLSCQWVCWSHIHSADFIAWRTLNPLKNALMLLRRKGPPFPYRPWSRFWLSLSRRSWSWSSLTLWKRFRSCGFGHLL